MLLGFGGLLFLQYFREQQLIQQAMESHAISLADTVLASLKHAMAGHDLEMVNLAIENTAQMNEIVDVKFIDSNFVVWAGNTQSELGTTLNTRSSGCVECHRSSTPRPRAVSLGSESKGVLRVVTPIHNYAECQSCHGNASDHIGILLIDVSQEELLSKAKENVLKNLILSVLVITLISVLVYTNIDRLITRRIKSFRGPLDTYAHGDLTVRLPISKQGDELDGLAEAFNHMARDLELHIENSKRQGERLQKTIVEERERIARDLHDSLPQLLAYFNTKIGAIRLFLENENRSAAIENLHQLEMASRGLFNDVREAIIGLRMSRKITEGLIPGVKAYIEQFTQFCGLPVDFTSQTAADVSHIDPEIQVHILRIIQEALSNVRKHANATQASVVLSCVDGMVHVLVKDDGQGFNSGDFKTPNSFHFGLQTIRERTEAIGGTFELVTESGKGTLISVKLRVR